MLDIQKARDAARAIVVDSDAMKWDTDGTDVLLEVMTIEKIKTRYAEQTVARGIDINTGEPVTIYLTVALSQGFDEAKVVPGDVVYIRYEGKKDDYKEFSMAVDRLDHFMPTE